MLQILQNARRARRAAPASPQTYNTKPTTSTLAPATVPCCPVCSRQLVITGGVKQLDIESNNNHLRLACPTAACAVEVWGILAVTGQAQTTAAGTSLALRPGATSCACTRAAYGQPCQCGCGVRS